MSEQPALMPDRQPLDEQAAASARAYAADQRATPATAGRTAQVIRRTTPQAEHPRVGGKDEEA
ncbi:hypothetical protein [Streptomyces zhihengii]|uniref:Uncharacterized protein n=1 Tax=Streptomyces zhihengii TaxID=1818004 RepID=A0ABS2V4K9_9ACTN|nr:hypothetical protein [Streptomyces zhihengii]MBM9624776.1 hypothetical protein [Streptomyces zhihengii]